jgi:hypothetical protein
LTLTDQNRKDGTTNATSEKMEQLMKHLLDAISIHDASTLLKEEDITDDMLQFLYNWMLANDGIASDAYDVFALALQRKDVTVNVSLQQRFASRALQRYRIEHRDDEIALNHADEDEL